MRINPRRPPTFPDFLGIGAQKSGTSWLYQTLRRHPELWLPKVKELHYFDQKIDLRRQGLLAKLFGREPEYVRWRNQFSRRLIRRELDRPGLRDLPWYWRYFFRHANDRWYASLFAPAGERLAGEITPSYAVLPPERVAYIHRLMPDAKIFFMIRNPVERAWSGAIMEIVKRSSLEASQNLLVDHFESEVSRVRTHYLRTLEVWGAEYPPEQIFIGFLEDIAFRPDELVGRIHAFLGVAPRELPKHQRSKVHRGVRETIPLAMAVYLARIYRDTSAELARRFGGHASWWAYVAERLLEEPETWDEIPYPFWEHSYWRDWIELNGFEGGEDWVPPLQSGVLSDLDRALQPR